MFKNAVGLAAAGAAGGSALSNVTAPSALAAINTPTGMNRDAPAVVVLIDAPTIAVDAALGNDFRITIAGNRTMGNPANPVDGQKIAFQVTQGPGGPFTITWGNSYEFAVGLPEPRLSTTPGSTDLLGFIYNKARNRWLHTASVNGFGSVAVTDSKDTYRLFSSVVGPSQAIAYTGPFTAGMVFEVTTGGIWFEGYWWWVCDTGQSASRQKFALWQVYADDAGSLITSATARSGTLTAGRWNYVRLPKAVPLAIGTTYIAATGFRDGFPETAHSFGSGDRYRHGIVDGPLTGYSDQSGTRPAPFSVNQGSFKAGVSDPTRYMPAYGYDSSNFWIDVQVTDVAPAGASYRLWPNYPTPPNKVSNDTGQQTTGTQFRLAGRCRLDNIWFYSPPGVSVLPSRCAIWDVTTKTVVAATDNTSPSWSGAAGSGWVACAYSGIELPAGDYKTSIYYGGGQKFYTEDVYYFSTGGGARGISAGPLSSPNVAHAAPCISNSLGTLVTGNSTYQDGPFSYPYTFDTKDHGENRWIDVEVTPVSSKMGDAIDSRAFAFLP